MEQSMEGQGQDQTQDVIVVSDDSEMSDSGGKSFTQGPGDSSAAAASKRLCVRKPRLLRDPDAWLSQPKVCTDNANGGAKSEQVAQPLLEDGAPGDDEEKRQLPLGDDGEEKAQPPLSPSPPSPRPHPATPGRLPVDLRTMLMKNKKTVLLPEYGPERDPKHEEDVERFKYKLWVQTITGIRGSGQPPMPPASSSSSESSDQASQSEESDASDASVASGDESNESGAASDDSAEYFDEQFVDTTWPRNIPCIGANFNPYGITSPFQCLFGKCDCQEPCRIDTCRNGHLGIFCTVECCRFMGKCGNGLVDYHGIQMERLRLMRIRGSADLTVIATEPIDQGVILGEYFGELSLQSSNKKNRPSNEGYRFHLHENHLYRQGQRVCINALRLGTLMRFVNHACEPAAQFYEVSNKFRTTVVVATCRPVEAGEEITADYGDDIWFQCRCEMCTNRRA